MQDDLKLKSTVLKDLKSECKTQTAIVKEKNKILDEINKETENKEKIDILNTMISHANVNYKKMRH
jgi:hypothetical protein